MNEKLIWLKTDRLEIYHPDRSDLDLLCKLLTNKKVNPYTLNSKNKDEIKISLDNLIAHYNKYNFSAGLIYLKNTSEFIGRAGLIFQRINKDEHLPCLIYHLLPEYWGQGYAHEAVKAIIDFAFHELNYKCVFVFISKDNISSQKLISKFKPKVLGETLICNLDQVKYIIEK